MKKYIDIDCANCFRCCRFNVLKQQYLSLERIQQYLFFSENLCDTFFKKIGDEYFISNECINLKKNNCIIHEKLDYPMICGLYPFMVALNKKNDIILALDKNCPRWKDVLNQLDEDYYNKLDIVLKFHKNNKSLEVYSISDLKECGYILKILNKKIIF